VTISSARTGIVAGAVPFGGLILSLEKMNQWLELKYSDKDKTWCLILEPGVSIKEIKERLDTKSMSLKFNNDTLKAFKEDHRRFFYPPDPTETTALIGGTVATNASGARTFKYGATREFVKGLRVVIPNGEVLEIRRGEVKSDREGILIIETTQGKIVVQIPTYTMPAVKNAAGIYATPSMDIIDLFIGSEGILGVISEVEINLVPTEDNILAIMAFFPTDGDAIEFSRDIRGDFSGERLPLEAIEFFDTKSLELLRRKKEEEGQASTIPSIPPGSGSAVFFELSYKEEELDDLVSSVEGFINKHHSSMDTTWAGFDENELEKMKDLRHALPEAVNSIIGKRKQKFPSIHKVSTDMALPDEYLSDIFDYYVRNLASLNLDYVIFGHIGNNHLHINILPEDEIQLKASKELYTKMAEHIVNLGGTVAAEHGIGKVKRDFLKIMFGEKGIKEMQAVKYALDPKGILNPGCMI